MFLSISFLFSCYVEQPNMLVHVPLSLNYHHPVQPKSFSFKEIHLKNRLFYLPPNKYYDTNQHIIILETPSIFLGGVPFVLWETTIKFLKLICWIQLNWKKEKIVETNKKTFENLQPDSRDRLFMAKKRMSWPQKLRPPTSACSGGNQKRRIGVSSQTCFLNWLVFYFTII